jgi:ubiquinone/menaquinone biosynthesis C-methylase UbiE
MKKYTYLDFLANFGVGGAHPGGLLLTKHIFDQYEIDENTSVLDVGCGTGQTAAFLSLEYNCFVDACDVNKIMVEKAAKRFDDFLIPIEVREENAENLSYDGNLFHFVLYESVLNFMNLEEGLKEAYRVLQPDGTLLAIEMLKKPEMTKSQEKDLSSFYNLKSLLSIEDWQKSLKEAGFTSITLSPLPSLATNNEGIEHGTEFILSPHIEKELYDFLDGHEKRIKDFESVLDYRIIQAKKEK